jgi:hypothetical protein
MSRIAKRDAAALARVVPQLAPETLHQLILHRGLDACGEIVTAATPAQLTSVLDLDLWRHALPGQDERFDVERFGEWLDVLVDTGESVAAHIVSALDKSLVVAGLSRYVRVFDPGIFEPTAQSDDEAIDFRDAMREGDSVGTPRIDWRDDRLSCEVGGYIVRARRSDAWDSIVALLLALDTEHPDDFHAVMQGVRRLSNSRPEVSGFDDLLMAPEQHLHDVAIERERRRSQQGYATPADARAFLQMARQSTREPVEPSLNPIAAAYFRAAEEGMGGAASSDPTWPVVLQGEGFSDPVLLLPAGGGEPRAARLSILGRVMDFVLQHDESAFLARSRELAFLANTLLAGCSVQSRPFTAREASDAAACICNLGLESRPDTPDAFLVDHDLLREFEAGWSVLHQDVSLFVAISLEALLADIHHVDAGARVGLRGLQRELAKQIEAGTPWLARDAAGVLASLDQTAWISVLGLLDECPILPATLTAILERRTTPVSPIAFAFISSTVQLADVRLFMRTLPALLLR